MTEQDVRQAALNYAVRYHALVLRASQESKELAEKELNDLMDTFEQYRFETELRSIRQDRLLNASFYRDQVNRIFTKEINTYDKLLQDKYETRA